MQRMLIFFHKENLAKDQQRIPIPAECRLLIATREVVVDQSNITNESLCVNKSVGDILLYASLLVRGDALAIVLCSAQESYVSRALSLGIAITLADSLKFGRQLVPPERLFYKGRNAPLPVLLPTRNTPSTVAQTLTEFSMPSVR